VGDLRGDHRSVARDGRECAGVLRCRMDGRSEAHCTGGVGLQGAGPLGTSEADPMLQVLQGAPSCGCDAGLGS